MEKHTDKKFNPIPMHQINKLTAMYDDYLYSVRQHEQWLNSSNVADLEFFQKLDMYQGAYFNFPWHIEPLTLSERQHFTDFINEDIHENTGKAYILLEHINPRRNHKHDMYCVPDPYKVALISPALPSQIERHTVIYPKEGSLQNLEFYVGGFYKATYLRGEDDNSTLDDTLNSPLMYQELQILGEVVKDLEKNRGHVDENEFQQIVSKTYAEMQTHDAENQILELLGSFAEKIQSLCCERYCEPNRQAALNLAQEEDIIHSADDFHDYMNIRNLMQHQWDTLEQLGNFDDAKAKKLSYTRLHRVKSYLKLCDKPIHERLNFYLDVLHQMQPIISKFNPNRIIRGLEESNEEFIQRVQTAYRQKPKAALFVELNYPLTDNNRNILLKNLQKTCPSIKITDNFSEYNNNFEHLTNDYDNRSMFLTGYRLIECQLMNYCLMRGQDISGYEAWTYAKDQGIISEQDYKKWCNDGQRTRSYFGKKNWDNYGKLRNTLSHEYYNADLRDYLRQIEEPFIQDMNVILNKIQEADSQAKWISKGVREFTHKDGLVIQLDYLNHKISDKTEENKADTKDVTGIEPETYPNGIEYILSKNDEKILAVKFPNGIEINMEAQSISWDNQAHLYMDAGTFNVLQTKKSKVFTDKRYSVTDYIEENASLPVYKSSSLYIDNLHRAIINDNGVLTKFQFKTDDNRVLQTNFITTKNNETVILLGQMINVVQSGKEITVFQGNQALTYENRQEFAAAYTNNKMQIALQAAKRNRGAGRAE